MPLTFQRLCNKRKMCSGAACTQKQYKSEPKHTELQLTCWSAPPKTSDCICCHELCYQLSYCSDGWKLQEMSLIPAFVIFRRTCFVEKRKNKLSHVCHGRSESWNQLNGSCVIWPESQSQSRFRTDQFQEKISNNYMWHGSVRTCRGSIWAIFSHSRPHSYILLCGYV